MKKLRGEGLLIFITDQIQEMFLYQASSLGLRLKIMELKIKL
jgi:hypothetical protein